MYETVNYSFIDKWGCGGCDEELYTGICKKQF